MNTFLLSINWNPSPELFNLFGLPVRYYGLLWAVGIFLAYIIVHYQYRDKKIDEKKFDPLFFYCFFGMDGDEADLHALVQLKKSYSNILLYVDEAHAFGVRGDNGLGCAEEQNCINDIDFLVGTFGKAIASAGAYIACRQVIREYLINKMRTFIFTTALPPINIQWTSWILEQLPSLQEKRTHLLRISNKLKTALVDKGYNCPSVSHIVPMIVGASENTICKAEEIQRKGFYALPVRPPTVPEGTSRIRFSLTADITEHEIDQLIKLING